MRRVLTTIPNTGVGRRGAALLLATLVLLLALAAVRPTLPHFWDGSPSDAPPGRPADWTPSYARDVSPILGRACVRCHGPQQADKGLRLDSYQRIMAGDSYGTVLIPGGSSLSAIISVVKYGAMPHDSARLAPEEVETLVLWIDAGAPEN